MFSAVAADSDEVIIKAMKDEIKRSKTLSLPGLETPYYTEYYIEDADMLGISASLGGLISESHTPARVQTVKVRVGDYKFDNTNYVFSEAFGGVRYDMEQLPLEMNYLALRHILWLANDRAFKTAEEGIAHKKSALKNVSLPDALPDYTTAQPVKALLPVKRVNVDEAAWKKRIVDLSAIFGRYHDVQISDVEFSSVQSADYLVNSEGSELRLPDKVAYLRIRGYGQAKDGYLVRDAAVVQAADVSGLPGDAELQRAVSQVAENVTALAHSSQGYAYDGPVLFEAEAAAQLFGQMLGDNLKVERKPVPEPGRTSPYAPSELETRIGSRILPEWMDLVDDPSKTEFGGHALLGNYQYDMEAIAPKPLTIVEHGILKDVYRTRTPVMKQFEGSNGHARFPGPHGSYSPGIGNLFVRANQTVSDAALKAKLIDMCKQRNKPYGIIVRKLDWPSSASLDEFRREISGMANSGGRPVAMPLLVYRVDTDGKEELVRGVRFRGLSTRSLKDIVAAGDHPAVYNYLDSRAPFALMGVGSFVTNSSIIAPAMLFEEVELEQILDELPSLPLVPAPTVTATR